MNKNLILENNNMGDTLKIRLGYACISNSINDTCSTPYTYSEFLTNCDYDKLNDVILSNLGGLEKIIFYNIKNNVHFFRMSSKIIPLATKDDVVFDYIEKYENIYERISKLIFDSKMRVDFHPDQYCVLNSTKKEVVDNSIKILEYHYRLLDALKIKDKILGINIGSGVLGNENSMKRFINNFKKLPKYLKEVIAIENDDKVFNVSDVCKISDILNVPIVLDYHHYNCNKSDIDIKKIFESWGNRTPKVHYSSPRNSRDFRSHNDYINSDDFINFLKIIKEFDTDIDVMIEAKAKDDALFRLVREIKYKKDYVFEDETSFYV